MTTLNDPISVEEKRARLAQLLREKASQRSYPLSFSQERLWFLEQLEPNSPLYNLFTVLRLRGALNIRVLTQAVNELVKRHESLRTVFVVEGEGRPAQRILPELKIPLELVDLRGMAEAAQEAESHRLIQAEAQAPFHLTEGPLLRARLIRLADEEHLALLNMHHIITDGWSVNLFIGEMAALYHAFSQGQPSPLRPVAMKYADFAVWQRQHLQGELLDKQIAYWKKQLAGAAPLLELPTDHPRPPVQRNHGANHHFTLPAALVADLKRLSQQEGTTLFMTLLAAWKVLLYRYSGQADVVVGSPIANRTRAELEGMMGFFVNTLVLRTDLAGNPTFRELLQRVKQTALGAYNHQDLPFEQLVEAIQPPRNLSYTPLFQVLFVLQNTPKSTLKVAGLTVQQEEIESTIAKFDMNLVLADTQQGMTGTLEYNRDLFDPATIRRFCAHFEVLLQGVVAHPEQAIGTLPLLTLSDKAQLLTLWNATEGAYPDSLCWHDAFTAQAERTPHRVAVAYEAQALTYAELNQRANQLAHYLQALGVAPDRLVGLYLERSPDLIVCLMAILKAGGAYLPLDPTYPAERIQTMVADAKPAVLLTRQALMEQLPDDSGYFICLDRDAEAIASFSSDAPLTTVQPDNLAYLIYTSGSTGKPKGVMVTHRSVMNLAYALREAIGQVGRGEEEASLTVSVNGSVSFDTSVKQLVQLVHGHTLAIVPQAIRFDGEALVEYLEAHRIDLFDVTPSQLRIVIENIKAKNKNFPTKTILIGGETIDEKLWQYLANESEINAYNVYGPTECTVDSTITAITPTSHSTIGRPITNTQIYILDSYGNPAPIGVAGELFIGGIGASRGYLQHPTATATKFVPDPFSNKPGARLYRTGDLVRYRPDGKIEFIGRVDNQVKIRGFRIELGEIEAVLAQHPTVQDVAVLVQEQPLGNKQLIAYVGTNATNEAESATAVEVLRHFLQKQLPEYMIPTGFVLLDKLPLSPNGKVDRRALAALGIEATTPQNRAYIAPRTPAEAQLAEIWEEILAVPQIGVEDNFFEVGGHSLLATQLASRIRSTFHTDLPLRTLFEAPTIAGLAQRLTTSSTIIQEPIPPRPATATIPLSFAQERLWFLDQLEPNSPFYNIPAALRLQGKLEITVLEQALNALVTRHESLRTRFLIGEERKPYQDILPEITVAIVSEDLRTLLPTEKEKEAQRRTLQEAQSPFDLAEAPLFRFRLLRLDEEEHLALLTLHHIITDGWSTNILVSELATLYQAFAQGVPSPLSPLALQYPDIALWQRNYLQGERLEKQVDYWKTQLAEAPPLLELPTDYPRPPTQSFRGAKVDITLSAPITSALKALSRKEDSTLFMTLLAAFKVLLYRHSGQSDIIVGSPIANRTRTELETIVGFFVNTLVLRTQLANNPDFLTLLQQVREKTLAAYAHQEIPFEQVVDAVQPERNLSYSPLFQVMFVLQNNPRTSLKVAGLKVETITADSGIAKFDLTLTLAERGGELVGNLEYNSDLFERATIERLRDHFHILLEAIVAHPRQSIGTLPLLTVNEALQVVTEWNREKIEFDRTLCMHQWFEAQVIRTPNAVALIDGNERITYTELNQRANQVAHHLQQLGIEPEQFVGVCMHRSASLIVSLLAILKAGGAYAPLDPAYPADRLAYIVENARVQVILTQEALLERLPDSNAPMVCIDRDADIFTRYPITNPDSTVTARHLGYVIYTSGSTGKPKGVAITHANAGALLAWAAKLFTRDELAGMLASTSINFDLSVYELFLPLSMGGKIILAENLFHLPALPAANEVTLVNSVPSVLSEFFKVAELPPSVITVNLAGEPLPYKLAQQVYQRAHIQKLYNLYGPSEDTTYSTWALVEKEDTKGPAIGRPIANSQLYLLDSFMQPVPIGVAGEVYLGGEGVAQGYLHRPGLTAEKFLPDPFSNIPGARMYRAGDMARYRTDGNAEYMGRRDHQVKVRGFRIELGEIEAVLAQHPDIQEAVVIVREDVPGDKRLVGYVVSKKESNPALTVEQLRLFLQSRLPAHMVPTAWVFLPVLPQTPNGKVDRRALPAPEHHRVEAEHYQAARTPTEQEVATVWAEVLRIEKVSREDNFFALGGHSLLATQVIARLRAIFTIELPLRALFEAPTVAGLAHRIENAQKAYTPSPTLIRSTGVIRNAPLSFAQERLWFLDQLEAGSNAAYNVLAPLKVTGALDEHLLTEALNEVIRRHEALRTIFLVGEQGRPVQQVLASVKITPTLADLRELPPHEREAEIRRHTQLEAQQSFDLANGPLVRLRILQISDTEHLVLLTIHHIVTDGWSTNILIGEIAALYPALLKGLPSPLPELTLQYPDVAIWQRNWLQGEILEKQVGYWRRQLAATPPLLELPTDHPRPAVQRYHGANSYFTLPAPLTLALKQLSQQEGVTLFMTLLAAFKILLYRYSGQSDIVVGSPIANRTRAELEGLIGFFVNTLALRTELADIPDFRSLLQRVREVLLDGYAHQELPFEQLVEAVQPPRSLAHAPIFQVLFVLQNSPRAAVHVAGLTVEPANTDGAIAKFDITLTMEERQGTLIGVWEYNTDLFERSTMQRWASHFQTLLESIVADPEHSIATLPLLPVEERELLESWKRIPPLPDSWMRQWLATHPDFSVMTDFPDIQSSILDEQLQPVPIGVRGEWYLQQGDSTLYRTGELARYLPDGRTESMGRVEAMVKVRGVRISLSEIEATLAEHPDIAACAVLVRHDPPAPQRLVGYLVLKAEQEIAPESVRQFLQSQLPTHHIPTAWVMLPELPTTADGMIDREALPAPIILSTGRGSSASYLPPRTPLESQLATLWADILQVERVGREDNFFALGGHSLLATQMVARVRHEIGIELPLRLLFEISTIAGLASHIEQGSFRGTTAIAAAPIIAMGRSAPLSFAQERLWFLDQLEPNSALYNVSAPIRLQGELDIDRLAAALNEVVKRHEALRTQFGATSTGQPIQHILPALTITPTLIELSEFPAEEREEIARGYLKTFAQQPFNLAKAPLIRLELIRLAEDTHIALLTMHHIITDGWSLNVLVSEIATLYALLAAGQPAILPPLQLQYADFAQWQRAWLQGEVMEAQVGYWREQLKGAPPLLELPTDRPRPAIQRFHGGSLTFTVPAPLTESLKQVGYSEGATLFMTLLAAFKVLLFRYSGQTDIVVGSPIANRTRAELESLIGFFVNTLVLRATVADSPAFTTFLRRVREMTLEAFSHQDLPFEQVVEAVEPPRSLSHPPLFQVMFVLQNTPKTTLQAGALTVQGEEMESVISKFDLTLTMAEQTEGMAATLEYNSDLFDHATVMGMAEAFQTLLGSIVTDPSQSVTTLPLVGNIAQQSLLNDSSHPYDSSHFVPQLIEAWATQTPTHTALLWEGNALSYAALNRRANQLAHYLQSLGVRSDVPVALCLPRSPELVVAAVAVLKAGGAYLPLDPAYPAERVAWMVANIGATLLLTLPNVTEPLPLSGVTVLELDSLETTLARYPENAPPLSIVAENLAYIIYTSGSTGTPKGTMLTHRGLLNLIYWHQRTFGVTSESHSTLLAGVGFDASVWELFPYLTAGATIHIPDEESRTIPERLQQWLLEEKITIAFLPTPLAERLIPLPWGTKTPLRMLLTGGDRLTLFPPSDLPFALINNYGPTEYTVVTTSITVTPDSGDGNTPSIGYPIDNSRLYLLDRYLTPVPQGVAGELYIGGDGLARGYLHQAALTAERFIPNPFGGVGERLYKTGDLARYRTDGTIEFLGRIDHQIKVRGFRIELGEIETLLTSHPAVEETVVTVHESASGDSRIVAYIVPYSETITGDTLRHFLEPRLPDYMIPTAWVILAELPLTPNGKVDRRALPSPDENSSTEGYVPPRTLIETQLAALWAELLGVRQISVHANFFAVGGHSLLAVQLMARIEQQLGIRLPLALLFREPTIERLAQIVSEGTPAEALTSLLVPLQRGNKERSPLFLVHPVGGNAFAYMPLVAQMEATLPIYGLQSRGLEGEASSPHTTIEAMAAEYIRQIRTVQPEGPYHLGGWSMGGVVAYEMAQQLYAEGQSVASLVMIDSRLPNRGAAPSEISLLATFALDMGLPLPPQETISDDLIEGSNSEERLAWIVASAKRAAILPPDISFSQVHRLYEIFRQNVLALGQYVPRPYAAPVTLLRAEQSLPGDLMQEETGGWETLIPNGLTVQMVPGNHFTMVRLPHVAALAQWLSTHDK